MDPVFTQQALVPTVSLSSIVAVEGNFGSQPGQIEWRQQKTYLQLSCQTQGTQERICSTSSICWRQQVFQTSISNGAETGSTQGQAAKEQTTRNGEKAPAPFSESLSATRCMGVTGSKGLLDNKMPA